MSSIPTLLAALEDDTAAVAIGSRYVAGGTVDAGWPWTRRVLSWAANNYVDTVLHLGVRDATAGFKAWRADALDAIDLPSIASCGYAFQIETAFRARRLGLPIVEVPIHFVDRTRGTSKMSLAVQLEAAVVPWRLRRQAVDRPAARPAMSASARW